MATSKNLNQYVIKVQKGGTKRRKPNKTEENLKTNALLKIRRRIMTERASANREGTPSIHEFPPEVSERIERTKKYRKRQRALKEAIRRRRTQERVSRALQAETNRSNQRSADNQRNAVNQRTQNQRSASNNAEWSPTNYSSNRSPNSQATVFHPPSNSNSPDR